jgi:hypothetical protein
VAVVKAAQSDKLVRKHTDSAEWKEFLKAHSEITDDLINDTNKSTTGSPSHKLSLSRDSDSGEVPDLEDTEGSEDAGDVLALCLALAGVLVTVLLFLRLYYASPSARSPFVLGFTPPLSPFSAPPLFRVGTGALAPGTRTCGTRVVAY